MSLLNNLYHIIDERAQTISFNVSHPIFAGHFPDKPVVPGACLVQISEELLSRQLNMPIQLTGIRNLKFRRVITPEMQVCFNITIDLDNTCSVTVSCLDEPYAQFAATYMCINSDI